MNRQYTAFTKDFKLEVLKLAKQATTCIAQLARDLGIRTNMIYKWRKQLETKQDKAFKRTATDNRIEHHKATHGELLKQNKLKDNLLPASPLEDVVKTL